MTSSDHSSEFGDVGKEKAGRRGSGDHCSAIGWRSGCCLRWVGLRGWAWLERQMAWQGGRGREKEALGGEGKFDAAGGVALVAGHALQAAVVVQVAGAGCAHTVQLSMGELCAFHIHLNLLCRQRGEKRMECKYKAWQIMWYRVIHAVYPIFPPFIYLSWLKFSMKTLSFRVLWNKAVRGSITISSPNNFTSRCEAWFAADKLTDRIVKWLWDTIHTAVCSDLSFCTNNTQTKRVFFSIFD